MGRTFVFFGGDSWPQDRFIEDIVRTDLVSQNDRFVGHEEVMSGEKTLNIELRSQLLLQALTAHADASKVLIIIGRSSGARIATVVAPSVTVCWRSVRIVAMAYPFENPAKAPQPERYLHLRTLPVLTLIVQGRHDEYGGPEISSRYMLSPQIQTLFVQGNHDLRLSADEWESLVKQMLSWLS